MWFDTPAYGLFLILIVVAYWQLNHKRQNVFLLLASYFFYGWWDWRFLLLMISSTTLDYLIAHAIARASSQMRRKRLLVLSLFINFGILGLFKYFNFFVTSGAGFVLFVYGRKQERWPQLVAGLVLMIYPYFVGTLALSVGIAFAIVAIMWLAIRQGY